MDKIAIVKIACMVALLTIKTVNDRSIGYAVANNKDSGVPFAAMRFATCVCSLTCIATVCDMHLAWTTIPTTLLVLLFVSVLMYKEGK